MYPNICCILLFVLIGLTACKKTQEKPSKFHQHPSFFEYSTTVTIKQSKHDVVVISGHDSVVFKPQDLPIKSLMCIPTPALAYVDALDQNHLVKGISQPKYIYNPIIHQQFNNHKIQLIGNENEILIEPILQNPPDLLISFSNPLLNKYHKILKENGIKVLLLNEYNEQHPLGKSELLKLFGVLFKKTKKANDLFNQIKQNYNQVKQQSKHQNQPKVMAGVMYGDIWYAPGGNSFWSQLIEDAGGDYVFESNQHNAQQMSFEQVYSKHNNADVWINASDFNSLTALRVSYPNYEWLLPYQNKKVYNYIAQVGSNGANNMHELGVVRADLVVKDLAQIFYPNLRQKDSLVFYKKLD